MQVFLGSSGAAKVLLLTNRPETPALFNALAANFRQHRLAFGDVHSSDTEAVEFLGTNLKASRKIGLLCAVAPARRLQESSYCPAAGSHKCVPLHAR